MDTVTSPVTRYRDVVSDSARWNGFELRPGDIVVSTPPKAGTTWTQMLCALLVFDGPDFPAPLEQLSPWLDMLTGPAEEVHAVFAAQTHRRIIKTHTPLDGVPYRADVHYVAVGRDPRDIAVSFDHHLANLDMPRFFELRATAVDPADDWLPPPPPVLEDPAARFRHFVTSDEPGLLTLADVLHHLGTAWDRRHLPNVHLVHYADLQRDLPGELLRLGRALGFELTAERATELSEHASIERMRDRADEVAPGASLGLWRDTRRFIRNGGHGEWQAWITPADDAAYRRRVAALACDGLARWAHEGGSRLRRR